MPEKIIRDRLRAIIEHIDTIEERMSGIKGAQDFRTKDGAVIFDAILIRLQALGENIKKIESLHPRYVNHRLSIDVDNIIRFRDIISHHYEKMDSEIIFGQIPSLKEALKNHLKEPDLFKKDTPRLIEKKNKKGKARGL